MHIFHSCSGDFPFLTADDYEYHLRETLEEVRKNIPRVFVNLVLVGNLSEVWQDQWYKVYFFVMCFISNADSLDYSCNAMWISTIDLQALT